jgi:alginate O-acetyltransferase complex protein AlgI
MLFNSFEYAIFLPLVFILYWFVVNKNVSNQNILVLVVSYIFYGWWDWRFLGLIALSTILDFFLARMIGAASDRKRKKVFLIFSLIINLGILGFFKYYNFFIDSWIHAWAGVGVEVDFVPLHIILPVGVSFYTFQSLSYTIDVYRNELKASSSFVNFAAFVSFFPQLVAGPIERATNLLPQFDAKRTFDFDFASRGLRLILWGLFKKIMIADNCGPYVNEIFNHYESQSAFSLVFGVFLFSFQIYGDFSGYTDIARGSARLLGFELRNNFNYPYFSRDIAEFWRRWHISLNTWFKDYIYIPLGGSKGSTYQKVRNIFIIFLLSGFWHGANWTFIIWGLLYAIYFVPLLLSNKNRKNLNPVVEGTYVPTFREFAAIVGTFILVSFSWIFFRASSVTHAIGYIKKILTLASWTLSTEDLLRLDILPVLFIYIIIEWLGRRHETPLELLQEKAQYLRWSAYTFLILLMLGNIHNQDTFIYFQF